MVGGGIALLILFLISYGTGLKPNIANANQSFNNYYLIGILVRVFGTIMYIVYAFKLSDGSIDAFIYDNYAMEFAQYFQRGDFSPFYDSNLWRNNEFFYTNFVAYPAAFFIIITFDSTFGIYLLFSLLCFAGLVLLYKAFEKNYLLMNKKSIMLMLFLFPTLWFWTSTIGKDAFMFLGMGIVCLGINNRKLNYFLIVFGLGVLYAFRPPTAYTAVLALGSFFVLNLNDGWFLRVFKAGVGIALIIFLANYLSEQWGIEEFSNEELTELQQGTLHYNEYGGGVLDEKAGGIGSIPQGIVDVIARPFLWEIRNVLTLASAIEINAVLFLLFWKWKSVLKFIKEGLKHRLSTFSLAFVFIYVVTVGLFENNIGLIARHRAIIFPFLFLMAFAYDDKVKRYYEKMMIRRRMFYQAKTRMVAK